MAPRLRLAYLDDSACWDRPLRYEAGRLLGIYVYDTHQHVHCCELTPSYELTLIGYRTELPLPDSLQAALVDATEPGSVTYVHVWEIDALPRRRPSQGLFRFDPFRHASLPCTVAYPDQVPTEHTQAIAEALDTLVASGITTT